MHGQAGKTRNAQKSIGQRLATGKRALCAAMLSASRSAGFWPWCAARPSGKEPGDETSVTQSSFIAARQGWGFGRRSCLEPNRLLHSGLFLLTALTGRISSIRHLPAWLLLPLLWKFVAFHRGIPFPSAFENPQGFGAIATATPFPKIFRGPFAERTNRRRGTSQGWHRACLEIILTAGSE